MNAVDELFHEVGKVEQGVRELSDHLMALADVAHGKSPVELASAKVMGKRIARACDMILDEVEEAKKRLGTLALQTTSVKTKKGDRAIVNVQNDLALVHSDVEMIAHLAEHFFESEDREDSFTNITEFYGKLIEHVTTLLMDEDALKNVKRVLA